MEGLNKQTQSNSNKPNFKGLGTLLIWVFIAISIRWQIIEPRWIPSGSMLPTLQINDKILVEKIRPKTKSLFPDNIKRDSIVVFKPPEGLISLGYKEKTALIKRIVGVPGDSIEVRKGLLIRNGVAIDEIWIKTQMNYEMEQITVPEDSYWVLGDNRNNSLDSHIWGPLPKKNIIGTAIFRYWPINVLGPIRFPTQKNIERKAPLAIMLL